MHTINRAYKRVSEQVCRLPHLSAGVTVCVSVWWVNCGKTADWTWMLFGVVSGVGRWMGVLDGMEIARGKDQFWVNWASHCNQRGSVA